MAGAKLISKALQAAREAFSGRNVSPLGFYSKGAEEAAALRQAKGTPEQMRSMLINKQGVKATELDNAGFNDAFAGRPSVTREEIAKLLQDRAPKIEERVLGGKEAFDAERLSKLEREYASLKQHPIDDPSFGESKYNEMIRLMNIRDQSSTQTLYAAAERAANQAQRAQRLGDKATAERYFKENEFLNTRAEKLDLQGEGMANPPKHSAYQLPGGENYREVVLKLPSKQERDPRFAWFDPNTQVPREIAERNPEYRSSHWDDPNVLAHLRMSDRTDPTGRKILHLEELQSDWAQEGRKMGFNTPERDKSIEAAKAEIARLDRERYDLRNQLVSIQPKSGGVGMPLEAPEGYSHELDQNLRAQMRNIKDKIDELNKNIPSQGLPSAPYVTKTQDWTNLALKRALREAAEGNYDAIAWTPGKTQAARYPGGTPENEAKRLKGMIGYYDKMVPTQFQKLARDLDPNVAIERMRIPVQGQNTSAEDIARQLNMSVDQVAALPIDQKLQLIGSVRNTMELPSLTVTPEMREKIKQGLPLFTAPAVGLGAASQMQSGETPVTDEPRLDFAGGGGARKTPVTDESTPTVPKMDDYTLFSRRRLVPYGQSYAPNTSGRFEQGNMRIKQMQRAQKQATSGADFTPPDWEDNRPVKFVNRAAPVSRAVNTQQRVELPSWIAPGGLKVAPFNIGDRNSPTLPSFAYADRLEQSAPQSAGERAIAIAKGLPQQVYRAVTNPVETAKAVANAVLSGEDYQSSGEPVVQNGVINWGDPDNSADFFRADQALQELHPYVEPETPPEPANEGYSNGGIVSELLNEVVDFVNPGFAGGGEVGGEYDYVEPEMVYDDEYDYVEPETVYDDEYDYVEPETVYDDEYDYVEPEMAEDFDGFAHGGPALMQDEYPTEYLPEVGRQVMAGGGEVDNPIVDEAYGEPMSDRARMQQTVASIAPREGEAPVVVDGERTLQNYRNFPVRPGEATMRPADLSPRDKIAQAISGDGTSYGSELGKRAANLLVGSRGLPDTGLGVGVADLPMVTGIPLNIADISDAASKGRYGEAALGAALPAAFWARKPIGAALRTARDVIASPVGRGAAGVTSAAVMSPDDAEAANILKALKAAKQLFKGSDLIKKDPAAATEKLSERTPSGEVNFGQAVAGSADNVNAYHHTFDKFDQFDWSKLGQMTADNTSGTGVEKWASNLAKIGPWASADDLSKKMGTKYTLPVSVSGKEKAFNSLDQLEAAIRRAGGPEKFREKSVASGFGRIKVKDEEFGGFSYVALSPDNFKIKAAAGSTDSAPAVTPTADR